MKIIITTGLLLVGIIGFGQTKNPSYDSTLAKSLGADEYGMKKYIFVILKTGPVSLSNKTKRDSLFAGHLKNITRLAEEGKLVVAGPFIEKNDKTYRGIFILNVPTIEEANALLETDPTIKEQVLAAELYPWYGSAALSTYLSTHDKLGKFKL